MVFFLLLGFVVGLGLWYVTKPQEIRIRAGQEREFVLQLPFSAEITKQDGTVGVVEVNHQPIAKEKITIDKTDTIQLKASGTANLSVQFKLFGILPVRTLEIHAITPQSVQVCGNAIGIHMETKGVMVLGTSGVKKEDGGLCEPCKNRLKSGDYILEIDAQKMCCKEDVAEALKNCGGKELIFKLRRKGETIEVSISPVLASDQSYKIGAWIRDDTQGIGTLTYIKENGEFGALGHGITDVDTGLLMEMETGDCYTAKVLCVVKGKNGEPGEISGYLKRKEENRIGTVTKNSERGIFGIVKTEALVPSSGLQCETALRTEVKKGKAYIYCQIGEEVRPYEIEIEKVDYANENHSKGMVIRITDETLLEKTGGIVQGMSGSPIVQEGKLVGAVTHVLLSNPEKGYGIFIEDMLMENEEK